jgi:hypothetical protein
MIGANFARLIGGNSLARPDFYTPPYAPTLGQIGAEQGSPMLPGSQPTMAASDAQPATPFKLSTADKLGLFGDALTGRSIFAPMVNDRRQAYEQQQAEKRRAATAFDQWRMQQDYERANPAPRYFEANNGDQYRIGADGQPQRVFQDPTPKVTWTSVDLPNGQKQLIPTINGQIVGGSQAPAAGAPTLPQGFTVRPKGGAASQAGAPFPLRPSTR